MKHLALAVLFALMMTACYPNGPGSPYISTEPAQATLSPAQAEVTVEAYLYPTPTPEPADEYTLVILGQDETEARCARGERCGGGSHSDVFVIVHVVMGAEPKATVVLVPRNLYVTGFEMWSMAVWGLTGYEGVHQYVETVFGLPVDGVFVTRMDRFVQIVDALGGLTIREQTFTGEETLAFLRDNANNWGCLTYDCEGRIFEVAEALRAKAAHDIVFGLLEDSLFATQPLWETDLTWTEVLGFGGPYFAFEVRGGTMDFVRLWTPDIVRDDTPLEVRGMVPTRSLAEWMAEVLDR